MPPGRAWTPTGRFGWSISSSRPRQANGPTPFVWWPGNSDRAGPSGCGKMISGAVGYLPIRSAPTALFVAYFASAELGCHLALGWPLPARVLDLYVEFRNRPTASPRPTVFGLLGALTYHGLDAMDAAEKKVHAKSWRSAAVPGRRTSGRRCWPIASPTSWRWPSCSPRWSRSWISPGPWPVGAGTWGPWPGWSGPESRSIRETLSRLRAGWETIQDRLIREVDSRFGVFDGRTFKAERWAGWLARRGLPWPRLESGELALDDDTFREMARAYPDVALMRELRFSLSQLRLSDLAVGSDGRNRALLALPGQDGPEPTLQLPVHLRAVNVAPGPHQAGAGAGRGLRRLEPAGVRDRGLPLRRCGDDGRLPIGRPLSCVRQASRPDSSRRNQETHGAERELFKACVLGVQYGMGAGVVGPEDRETDGLRSGVAPAPSGDLPEHSGDGRTGPSPMRCS